MHTAEIKQAAILLSGTVAARRSSLLSQGDGQTRRDSSMSVGQYKSAKTRESSKTQSSQLCAVGFTPDGAAGLSRH
ncbi:hypothetical protein ACOJBM_01930 [Rhizobium beringeri]